MCARTECMQNKHFHICHISRGNSFISDDCMANECTFNEIQWENRMQWKRFETYKIKTPNGDYNRFASLLDGAATVPAFSVCLCVFLHCFPLLTSCWLTNKLYKPHVLTVLMEQIFCFIASGRFFVFINPNKHKKKLSFDVFVHFSSYFASYRHKNQLNSVQIVHVYNNHCSNGSFYWYASFHHRCTMKYLIFDKRIKLERNYENRFIKALNWFIESNRIQSNPTESNLDRHIPHTTVNVL